MAAAIYVLARGPSFEFNVTYDDVSFAVSVLRIINNSGGPVFIELERESDHVKIAGRQLTGTRTLAVSGLTCTLDARSRLRGFIARMAWPVA